MSSSVNEDQEQRTTTSMEEPNAMTIEFLRARLLSERSVSRTARQRADELAKRVAELEEQLKFVSLQRKKAEKATVDVLAILENRGISDLSEEFDSSSEQDESPHDRACNNSVIMRKNNEREAYSSSEIESSPSTGRSLSWKSSKDSHQPLEKKKYMDSMRRRASFASNSSSARRVGKSCRRIRRKETRSIEELQDDGTEKSRDVSNCSDGEPVGLRESSGHDNGINPLECATAGSKSETEKVNGHYFGGHEGDEDMESALQHQAQLIGRYEEEEKAQREWEEKYRENNSGTQDSCDLGNHSDVTEERYDIKSAELSCPAEKSNSDSQEMKQKPLDTHFTEEPDTSKTSPGLIPCESEFSFPMSKEKNDQDFPIKQHEPSPHNISQHCSHAAKCPPPYAPPSSSSRELAIVPQENSNNYGSVLEALERAKSSLREKLNSSSKVDDFKIPTVSPGIFRLPTDEQFEATHRPNPMTGIQSSFANFHPEIANSRFSSESDLSGDIFRSVPYRPYTPEIGSGVHPHRSLSHSRVSEGPLSYNRPSITESNPFQPETALRLPSSEKGSSSLSSSESGLPPVMRLSSYDQQRFGPNMYR